MNFINRYLKVQFQKIIKKRPEVFVALDRDAQDKEEKIIRDLLLHDIKVHKVTVPESCDIGDLTKEECAKLKQKASFVESTDYLLYQKIFAEAF